MVYLKEATKKYQHHQYNARDSWPNSLVNPEPQSGEPGYQ
jgi:hypothetical protein